MKKLMTMLAAVGMAFGLYADGFQTTGASFEPNGTYQGVTLTWDNNGFNQSYWSSLGESATFAGTYTFNKEIGYPTVFAKDHTQYLKIKTTLGTPAVMKIAENPVGVGDSGLYFDAMVNMTVFDYGEDSNPAIPTGTKIAAYLQLASDADNAATNFVVATVAEKRYVCFGADVSEGWHRITIKAIKNVYQTGKTAASAFKVFVDGVAVSCAAAKDDFTADDLTPVAREYWNAEQLFLSGVSTVAEIASVSFDGQGSVDDIVFTETIPFAAAGDAAKAQVVIAADAASVVTGVSTNGVDGWVTTYPAIFDAPIQGGYVYIRANGAYCLTKLAAPAEGGTLTVTESMLTKAKATFDNTAYETVALAVAEANKVTSGTHTLALIDDATAEVKFMNSVAAANTIVFDLAGKKLTGEFGNVMPLTAIVITNSTDVVGAIDGAVTGANLSIVGGKFLYSANEGGISATVPAGKKLVNDGATPAYWVLADVYTITINEPENGTLETSVTNDVVAGTVVTVKATPEPGYELDAITVKSTVGAFDVTVTGNTFEMPAYDVTVWATFKKTVTDHSVTISWGSAEVDNPIVSVGYTISPQGDVISVENGKPFAVADGLTITVVAQTKDWWKAAGTGDYTITADKDDIVITATQINPDSPATPAEAGIKSGAFANASKTDVGKVAGWAASKHVTLETVNAMEFDAHGNPTTQAGEAFLLGCADSEGAIKEANAQFKFAEIVPGKIPTPTLPDGANGTPVQLGADAVTGPWEAAKDSNKFFKSVLRFVATPDPDPVQ